MDELILQMIINKIENNIKKQFNINKINQEIRKKIRQWSIKMYQDFENSKELILIKENNLDEKDYQEYIDNNYLTSVCLL